MKYVFRQIFEESSQIIKRETEFDTARELEEIQNRLRDIVVKGRRVAGRDWRGEDGADGGKVVLVEYYVPKDSDRSYGPDFVRRARKIHPNDMWTSMWDGDKLIGAYKNPKIEGDQRHRVAYTWYDAEAEQIQKATYAYLDKISPVNLEYHKWMQATENMPRSYCSEGAMQEFRYGIPKLDEQYRIQPVTLPLSRGEIDRMVAKSEEHQFSSPLHTINAGYEAYKNMKDAYKQFIKEQFIKPNKMSKIKQFFKFLFSLKYRVEQVENDLGNLRYGSLIADVREQTDRNRNECMRRTDGLERRLDDIEFPQRFSVGESVVLKNMRFPVEVGQLPMKTHHRTAKCVVVSAQYEPSCPGKRMYEVMEIGSGHKATLNAETMAEKYVSDCELEFQEFLNNLKTLAKDEALKSEPAPTPSNWASTLGDLAAPAKKRGRPKKVKRGRPKKTK